MSQHSTESRSVPINQLIVNDSNPNVMSRSRKFKLKRHIQRNGLYPSLIVRELANGSYRIIDGHQRLSVLKELGHRLVECVSWNCSDRDELLFLATLNSLRGSDSYHLRSKLLRQLSKTVDAVDLKKLLPDDPAEVTWRVSLGTTHSAEIVKSINEKVAARSASLSTGFFVARCLPEEAALVEKAILKAGGKGLRARGKALTALARFYLENTNEE